MALDKAERFIEPTESEGSSAAATDVVDNPMTIREMLEQQNSDSLFYPERFDPALVGMTLGFRGHGETKPVAVYEYHKLIDILAADFAKDTDPVGEDLEERDVLLEAKEWVNTNMAGAYLGPNAPLIVIEQE